MPLTYTVIYSNMPYECILSVCIVHTVSTYETPGTCIVSFSSSFFSVSPVPLVLSYPFRHISLPSPTSSLCCQQHGYTVVADGWSGGEAIPAGSFLLRVVSSSPNLPQRAQVNKASQGNVGGAPLEKITSSFTANPVQQYYLPDRDLKIFR